jgi:hypothetical protein
MTEQCDDEQDLEFIRRRAITAYTFDRLSLVNFEAIFASHAAAWDRPDARLSLSRGTRLLGEHSQLEICWAIFDDEFLCHRPLARR